MLKFYRTTAIIFCCLVLLTLLLVFAAIKLVYVRHALLPTAKSILPWTLTTNSDATGGGSSTWEIRNETSKLAYEYFLNRTEEVRFPFVTQLVTFAELGNQSTLVDLGAYAKVTFVATCVPRNVIAFYVLSFDKKATQPESLRTYRVASTPFSCDEDGNEIEIDLHHLKIPFWWLERVNLEMSDQAYNLEKVLALGFDGSQEGPVNTSASVEISKLSLLKFNWHYLYIFVALALAAWIAFVIWTIKQYSLSLLTDLKERLDKDRPLIAYQKLHLEPHKDKEKNHVLHFMATEFSNPDLNIEMTIDKLGINRTKLNDLLKEEIGLTFNAYLNKLRLTAAAKQLKNNKDISIQDVAYAVGYNNVSYFHKLFKSEYGCAPKTFQQSG